MTPEEYRKISGREPDEDELEALAWLTKLSAETGAGIEVGDVRDIVENQNKEGGWIPRSDADSEGQKSKYVQQYALRGATGGDRTKGGYSTGLEDDPERVWTRGQAESPAVPGTEGQSFEGWKAPADLTALPTDIEGRIKAMFLQFLGRDATPEEIRSFMRSEEAWDSSTFIGGGDDQGEPELGDPIFTGKYKEGWEERLFKHISRSNEYLFGYGGKDTRTLSDKIKALYQKYGREEPSATDITLHKQNPRGLTGIEHALQLNPSEQYKIANPVQPFIKAGLDTPAVIGREASWNRPVPKMGDFLNTPPDPVPDPLTTDNKDSVDTRPTAQPVPAPRKTPYSARPITQPYPVNAGIGAPLTTPSAYPPGMTVPPAYQGTIGQVTSNQDSTPTVSGGDPSSWENYGGYYGRAGQDFQRGPQGGGYNPAPWANTDRLLRGQFGNPGLTGTNTNLLTGDETPALDESDADRRARRAFEFGRREGLGNQYNADLGNQDYGNQMDRWIQSWNQWNRQGVDSFYPPVGRRRIITGTGSSRNAGGF